MPDYPVVHRVSDPLMIRTSRFALQINDTIYWAKIKFGNSFCGFYGFVTGSSEHFYEYKDEELTESWSQSSRSRTPTVSERTVRETLEQAAQDWLDNIENALLDQKPDNAIKKAIDRLCWQLHYDITASDTDFTQFDDFANVQIDDALHTFYKTVTDSTWDIGTAIGGSATTIVGDSSSSSGLWNVSDQIYELRSYLTDPNTGALKTQIGDKLVADNDTCIGARLNKIATNLKEDNVGYTISRALREDSQASVSGATYQQTQLEQEHFETISQDQLGAFGETGNRTLFATIGSYATDGNDTMSQAIGQTNEDGSSSSLTGNVKNIRISIGDSESGLVKSVNEANGTLSTVNGTVSTISNTVSTINGNVSTINSKIGTPDNVNWTLFNYEHTNKTIVDTINGTVTTINNKIGDPNIGSTLWYDVLHNSGTQ